MRAVWAVGFAWLGLCGVAGCGPGSGEAVLWLGTMDTLSNGGVHVRNPARGLWGPGQEWHLVERVRLGTASGDGAEMFGQLFSLAVGPDDRIFLLDRSAAEIRVFLPSGAHVTSFGRQGQGPGELAAPVGVTVDSAGKVWVVDAGAGRYVVFNGDGTFSTTVPRPVRGFLLPWAGGFDRSQRMIDISGVPPDFLHMRIDPATGETHAFELPPFAGDQMIERPLSADAGGGTLNARVPFSPQQIHAVDGSGRLWVGVSDRYRLVLRTLEGDTIRIVERDVEAAPLTDAARDGALAGLKWFTDQVGPLDPSAFPNRQPYFSAFLPADDGHLWVVRYAPVGTGWTTFDVFDPEGRYLGEVQSPVSISPHPALPRIRNGHLNGVTEDEMGVPYFVRLRIAKDQ